jgi:hypothetical protein
MLAQAITRQEIWHRDHNLRKKHNLDELPGEPAVFAVFAIVNDEPANSRAQESRYGPV